MTAALAAAGWLDLGAAIVLVGGFVYGALVAPLSARGVRAAAVALVVVALALVLELALTALRLRAVSGVSGTALLVALGEMRWGRLWIVRAGGLIVLAGALRDPERRPRPRAALAALWLAPRSFQGHAGAHGTVPAIIDWLHFLAAAAWLGGLLQLALEETPLPALVAWRMRALATSALLILVPAGGYAVWLHVPKVSTLAATPYGRTLVAKLVCVLPLVALGARNHFRDVPALVQGDAAAGGRLGRSVRLELMIGVAVVLVTALLGVFPMPHEMPK